MGHEARPEGDDLPGRLYNTRDLFLPRLVSGEVDVRELDVELQENGRDG